MKGMGLFSNFVVGKKKIIQVQTSTHILLTHIPYLICTNAISFGGSKF